MFKINPTAGAAVSANLFAGVVLLASPGMATADDINPFDNTQPSLVITEAVQLEGTFPDPGGGTPSGNTLGFVYGFAGNFAPKGSEAAGGQVVPITQNMALFALLGTTYGGNGINNFALPNLQGQAIIGSSPSVPLGVATGSQVVTLSPAQIPPGGNQPFNNMQPSLPLTPLIFTGNTPPLGGSALFAGEIANFAGNFVPGGWAPANGDLLPIAQNQALFNVIGTTYGGNGDTSAQMTAIATKIDAKTATERDISSGRALLEQFKFCADPSVLNLQISTLVSFSLRMIHADLTGDADAYFYDIYNERKADVNGAIKQLSAVERKELRQSLNNTAVIWKKGNGAK